MEVILAAVVLVLAFAGLAYPLYVSRPRAQRAGSLALGELTAQRDGVYAMLRDLDQDYQIGKLDETDYRARREKYLGRATAVLRQIDAEQGVKGPPIVEDDAIEQEVAALRRARQERGSAPAGFCRHCGQPHQAGDSFCAKCGQALS